MENLNVLKTTTENTTRTSEQRAEQDKPIANREAVQSSSTSSTTTARPSMQENKVVELRNKTNQLETDQREEPHLNCSRKTLDGIECLWVSVRNYQPIILIVDFI
jgi:hypothetical protein